MKYQSFFYTFTSSIQHSASSSTASFSFNQPSLPKPQHTFQSSNSNPLNDKKEERKFILYMRLKIHFGL